MFLCVGSLKSLLTFALPPVGLCRTIREKQVYILNSTQPPKFKLLENSTCPNINFYPLFMALNLEYRKYNDNQ